MGFMLAIGGKKWELGRNVMKKHIIHGLSNSKYMNFSNIKKYKLMKLFQAIRIFFFFFAKFL